MADTVALAKNGGRVVGKILQRLERGSSMTTSKMQKSNMNVSRLKRRVWVAASADPAIDSGSQDTYPAEIGDWAYRVDSDEAFICSVAPAATTNASFITADADDTEIIKAAPSSGSHFIEKFTLLCNAEITITVGDGESSDAVETAAFTTMPIARQESAVGVPVSNQITYEFLRAIKLTALKALTIESSGAGAIWGIFEGFTI
jgi:hypothetical protein